MNPSLSSTALPVGYYDVSANVRVYLSRVELTNLPIETLHRNEAAQTKLFGDIVQKPGVAMLCGKPFELLVQKGDMYSWDEVHRRVLDELLAVNLLPMTPASDAKQ